MSDELLKLNKTSTESVISLDFLEETIGIKKEVLRAELGIIGDEINLSDFREKVEKLTKETFEY